MREVLRCLTSYAVFVCKVHFCLLFDEADGDSVRH